MSEKKFLRFPASEINERLEKVDIFRVTDATVVDNTLHITKTDGTEIEFQGGGGGSEEHTTEKVIILLTANDGLMNWHDVPVIITEANGKVHNLKLDETGETIGIVPLGVEYTITFPVVEGYVGRYEELTFIAEHYERKVEVLYRKSHGDLRDVARSFVVEASSSPVCELTGNEDVIDRILSHGSYVIDETNKKYARLSETDSNVFEDGTPWNGMYGNAFRYLPPVYILRDKDHTGSGTKYWVSDEPIGGDDALVLPESWIGMYKGSMIEGMLRSLPNVFTAESQTMTSFWNSAQRVGTDYGLVNYFDHQKLVALHLAKFGNMNSDETVGIGLCNAGTEHLHHKTGTTAYMGNGSGTAPYLTTSFKMPRLFGIEDLFGTTWEFRPNIRFDAGVAIVYEGNIVSNTAVGIRQFARLQNASAQYIKNMALGDHFDLVAANASGASDSTYWCDGAWAQSSGQLLVTGGSSVRGLICGISSISSASTFLFLDNDAGARLAFKGNIADYEQVSGAELASLHL